MVAYRPVEPSARVQIPASALRVIDRGFSDACFWFRTAQSRYRVHQAVLGDLAHVQAHLVCGLQNSFVDVHAGRHFTAHGSMFLHMLSCAHGLFIAP